MFGFFLVFLVLFFKRVREDAISATKLFSSIVVLLCINISISTSWLCKLYKIYFAALHVTGSVIPLVPDLQSLSQMIFNTETFVSLQEQQIMMVQLNVGQCINVQSHCVVVFRPVTGFIDRRCRQSDFHPISNTWNLRFSGLFVLICVLI